MTTETLVVPTFVPEHRSWSHSRNDQFVSEGLASSDTIDEPKTRTVCVGHQLNRRTLAYTFTLLPNRGLGGHIWNEWAVVARRRVARNRGWYIQQDIIVRHARLS